MSLMVAERLDIKPIESQCPGSPSPARAASPDSPGVGYFLALMYQPDLLLAQGFPVDFRFLGSSTESRAVPSGLCQDHSFKQYILGLISNFLKNCVLAESFYSVLN